MALEPTRGALLWTLPSPSGVGTPVGLALGADSLVYFSTACCVLAVDAAAPPGTAPVWTYHLRAPVPSLTVSLTVPSTPAGVVMFDTVDTLVSHSFVTALDASTGNLLWNTQVAPSTQLGGVVVGAGQRLFVTAGGDLVGLQGAPVGRPGE